MLAGPSPEVLIGPIASATEQIRVGSGGVMLPHYSPLKVAESFTILAALYPGRIDLGLGRAAGTDPLTTFALQRDRRQAAPDDFPQQLAELLAYFDDDAPRRPPVPASGANTSGASRAAGSVAARLVGSERDLGRRARAALRVRRLHQSARGRDRAALPRALHAGTRPAGAADRSRRLGAMRADRRGGPGARVEQPDVVHAAAARAADPGPAARQGARSSLRARASHRPTTCGAGARSSARLRRSGRESTSWRAFTAPTR